MKPIEEFYKLYKQDVYQYLLSLTKDPHVAEDLLSETFVRAIQSFPRFRGDSSVKTWLFAIARNIWLTRLRREKETVEFTDRLGLYLLENHAERLITDEIMKRIVQLLAEKDARTWTIIRMRAEGYSYAEISQKVKLSESSCRVIDFRTKKWLRDILLKEGWQ